MSEKASPVQIKKTEKLIATLICVAIIFTFFLFIIEKNSYSTVKETEATTFSQGSLKEIAYSVEGVTPVTGGNMVSGWCVRPCDFKGFYNYGMDKNFEGIINNYVVALKNDNMLYILPTKLKKQEAISNEIRETDCGFCGFEAMIPVKYTKTTDDYSVVFLVRDEKEKGGMILYDTGVKAGLINE